MKKRYSEKRARIVFYLNYGKLPTPNELRQFMANYREDIEESDRIYEYGKEDDIMPWERRRCNRLVGRA